MSITSLTVLTFLNILERELDEICVHLDKLPNSILTKLGNRCNKIVDQRNDNLVMSINQYIIDNKDRYNSMGSDNKIHHGAADYNNQDISIFLNAKDIRLLCIKINRDGHFYIRQHGNFVYDDYDTYDTYVSDILIEEFPTPWITEFVKYLGTIYCEWVQVFNTD